MKHWCKDVIIPNKHRIISLHLWKSLLVEEFFTQYIIDSLFTRLESIVLYGLTSANLISILPHFKSLPHLLVMTIYLSDYHSTQYIYQMIFDLPSLKYNSLSMDQDDELDALGTLSINQRFTNNIQSLIMNHGCTSNGLISIFYHTPQLNYLFCRTLSMSINPSHSKVKITSLYLTHFIIENCEAEFDGFENFMKKICSHIKTFRINQFLNDDYIDPDRWNQLIVDHMPQLRRFHIRCPVHIDDNFKTYHFDAFVHQFTSRFWFERGWNIKLEIEPEAIFYRIHSNR